MSVKCQTSPADTGSINYKLTIPIIKNEKSKEWLEWFKNIKRAAIGKNATGLTKFSLAKRLLEDGAL